MFLGVVITLLLLIAVVFALRLFMQRAEAQRRQHDARLSAMAQTYLAAMKKKQPAGQASDASQPSAAPVLVRDERECPFCAELILKKARVCKHCRRDVEPVA